MYKSKALSRKIANNHYPYIVNFIWNIPYGYYLHTPYATRSEALKVGRKYIKDNIN